MNNYYVECTIKFRDKGSNEEFQERNYPHLIPSVSKICAANAAKHRSFLDFWDEFGRDWETTCIVTEIDCDCTVSTTEKTNYDMLRRKLTEEEQDLILGELFSFKVDDGVIIDDDGVDFYRNSSNSKFNLSTLEGIFKYHRFWCESVGYSKAQGDIRKAIGIFNH